MIRQGARSLAVSWVGLPALVLVVAFVVSQAEGMGTLGYGVSAAGSSYYTLAISAPVSAACIAFDLTRLKQSTLVTMNAVRSRSHIIARLALPSFLLGIGLQAVSVALLWAINGGTLSVTAVVMLAAQIPILILHCSLGLFIGSIATPITGPAIAFAVSFFWLVYMWSFDFMPLRYLAGLVVSQCCSVDRTIQPDVLITSTVFSLGAAAAFNIALFGAFPHRARLGPLLIRFVTATAVIALIAGCSIFFARDIGVFPTAERDHDELHCSGTRTEICLYPESETAADSREVLERAVENLHKLDMPVPAIVVGSVPVDLESLRDDDDVVVLNVDSRMTPETVASLFASSYVRIGQVVSCEDDLADYEARWNAARLAGAWVTDVALRGGPYASPSNVRDGIDPSLNQRFDTLDEDAQRAWVLDTRESARDCSREVDQL